MYKMAGMFSYCYHFLISAMSDVEAMIKLESMLLDDNNGVNKNLILGIMYTIQKNEDLCLKHYRLAISEGNDDAAINLASYYHTKNVHDDESLDKLRSLADSGNLRAKSNLAYYCYKINKDGETAIKYYEEAVNGGYIRAAANLGYILAVEYQQYELAIDYTLLLLQHDITEFYDYTGHCYHLKGDIDNVVKYCMLDVEANGNKEPIIYLCD